MNAPTNARPPLIILGGSSNALAMCRNMARHGVRVYLSVTRNNPAAFSRYSYRLLPVEDKSRALDIWQDLLLGGKMPELHGAVIFPCNDDGVEFVNLNREALQEHYLLDDAISGLHLDMLDKQKTIEMARTAGVGVPGYQLIENAADVQKIDPKIRLPLIVKPVHSHLFQKAFGGQKLFFVHTFEDLMEKVQAALAKELSVILTEWLEGPDTLLSSYYTYVDRDGNRLFEYTKSVIRRFPKNNGQGCLHLSKWYPDTAAEGRKLFDSMGLRGLGNVEFKLDLKDNKLKIIECNPRFTAAHQLLVSGGMEIDWLIYCHLAGLPVPKIESYRQGETLWFPHRDFKAFLELRALGEITLGDWLGSILKPHVMPHFQWRDPMPTWRPFWDSVAGRLAGSGR